MADVDTQQKSSRKLPPLGHEDPDGTDGVNDDKKKKRRRKKKPVDEELPNGEDATIPHEEDSVPTVKKKKRRPKSATTSDLENPEAATPADDAPVDETTPRRKKHRKKKSKEEDPASPEETAADAEDNGTEKLVKKKRRKKRRDGSREKVVTTEDASRGRSNEGLAADLHDIEDDVIDAGKDDDEDEREDDQEMRQATQGITLQSQPLDTLYIEQKSNFRKEEKSKLAKRLADEEERRQQGSDQLQPSKDTLQFALVTHRVFRKFALICHGLLAGLACLHVGMTASLMDDNFLTLVSFYYSWALEFHEIFYALFLICTVSAFDRFDIAGMTRPYLIKCLTLQNGALSCLVYFFTTVVSLSTIRYDEKLNLYGINASIWDDISKEEENKEFLREWSILCAIRSGGAILGWVIIALQPSTDKLGSNLVEGEGNSLGLDALELNNKVTLA